MLFGFNFHIEEGKPEGDADLALGLGNRCSGQPAQHDTRNGERLAFPTFSI